MVKLDYTCPICKEIVSWCYYVQGSYEYVDGKRKHTKGHGVFKCSSCDYVEHREV